MKQAVINGHDGAAADEDVTDDAADPFCLHSVSFPKPCSCTLRLNPTPSHRSHHPKLGVPIGLCLEAHGMRHGC